MILLHGWRALVILRRCCYWPNPRCCSQAWHYWGDTNDAALQAFRVMSRELGRLLATLVVTQRQVWLAQSPISDYCRQGLHGLPVVPGQMFGPEAKRALGSRRQSRQRWFNGHRLEPQRHRRVTVEVSARCMALLCRWRDSTYLRLGLPLGAVPTRQEVVTTDTSPWGWGALWPCKSVQGLWDPCQGALNRLRVLDSANDR